MRPAGPGQHVTADQVPAGGLRPRLPVQAGYGAVRRGGPAVLPQLARRVFFPLGGLHGVVLSPRAAACQGLHRTFQMEALVALAGGGRCSLGPASVGGDIFSINFVNGIMG